MDFVIHERLNSLGTRSSLQNLFFFTTPSVMVLILQMYRKHRQLVGSKFLGRLFDPRGLFRSKVTFFFFLFVESRFGTPVRKESVHVTSSPTSLFPLGLYFFSSTRPSSDTLSLPKVNCHGLLMCCFPTIMTTFDFAVNTEGDLLVMTHDTDRAKLPVISGNVR